MVGIKILPVYDIPEVLNFNLTGVEDKLLEFTQTDFIQNFHSVDHLELNHVKILSLPTHGILKLSETPVHVNQKIDNKSLANLSFVPDSQWNGIEKFTWIAHDGFDYSQNIAEAKIII